MLHEKVTFFTCDYYRYDRLVNDIAKYDENILFSIPWGLKACMLHPRNLYSIKKSKMLAIRLKLWGRTVRDWTSYGVKLMQIETVITWRRERICFRNKGRLGSWWAAKEVASSGNFSVSSLCVCVCSFIKIKQTKKKTSKKVQPKSKKKKDQIQSRHSKI